VKHHAKPVGVGEVQRLFGISQAEGKVPLFFSANGFTPAAAKWAQDHKVECYVYPPVRRASVKRPRG
jgi:Restriction endonuclease